MSIQQNKSRKNISTRLLWTVGTSRRGQAMVEFALIAVVMAIVLLVGIQYALIGQQALALHQAAYQATRFAANNPNAAQSDVECFLMGSGGGCSSTAVASPTIAKNGGKYMSMAMSPTSARSFGAPVTITLNFDVCGSGSVFLANCGSFLGVAFPGQLTTTETAMTE